MEYILYCLFITVFIILGLNIIYRRKYNKRIQYEIEREKHRYIEQHKQILKSAAEKEMEFLKRQERDICEDIEQKQRELKQLHKTFDDTLARLQQIEQMLNEQREKAKSYEESLRESAQQTVKTYEQDLMKIADTRVAEAKAKMQQEAMKQHEELMVQLGRKAAEMSEQIQTLTNEINDYTAKQAAINEAIMRQRAIDEQQDFYRVCLAPETANDVSVLNMARQNLKKPEIIDKIIYDNYISKPVLEMVKRVLQNTTCSGIYKITCLKTGEIYIGKSTDIKSRWQQHCKSAFNCGTIAHSLLHTKMKQHGIEQFTFEVVEQVPKDQLSEREKFYINFYQTKETGLNERNG